MRAQDFKVLLESAAKDAGVQLQGSAQELAAYAAARSAYLTTLVGQKGFEGAVLAERDNVALRGGILAGNNAKAADLRLLGVIQGALFAAATTAAQQP